MHAGGIKSGLFFSFFSPFGLTFEKPPLKSNDSPSCSALPHPTALIEEETEEGGEEEEKKPLWFLGVALFFPG